jgi:hypothetical protein
VSVSGDDVRVGLRGAEVLCGTIETLEATAYGIDRALLS